MLGRLLYVSLTPQCLINEVHSTKGMSNKSSLDGVIEIAGRYVTDAMLATLQSHYEALRVERGEKTRLDLRELSPEDQERAALDVSFYSQNPHLPLENLCSKLNNYDPKNDSQRELLEYAGKLAEFPDLSKPAGIWAHGQAGVGKSHIAVALTKEFMRRGYQPNFVQFGANNKLMTPNLAPQQVWILDDFNSPYGMDRDTFYAEDSNEPTPIKDLDKIVNSKLERELLTTPIKNLTYILISESFREPFNQLMGFKDSESVVIPNGIDIQKFLEIEGMAIPKWLHLDIAGTAFKEPRTPEKSYSSPGATGWGVRLLIELLRQGV